MTPRIICGEYESDTDKTVQISSLGDNSKVEITVTGNNKLSFNIDYVFDSNFVKIAITAEKDVVYMLPIIIDNKSEVKGSNKKEYLFNNILTISTNVEIETEDLSKRYFNQVGGFEYLPLEIPLKSIKTVEILLRIK